MFVAVATSYFRSHILRAGDSGTNFFHRVGDIWWIISFCYFHKGFSFTKFFQLHVQVYRERKHRSLTAAMRFFFLQYIDIFICIFLDLWYIYIYISARVVTGRGYSYDRRPQRVVHFSLLYSSGASECANLMGGEGWSYLGRQLQTCIYSAEGRWWDAGSNPWLQHTLTEIRLWHNRRDLCDVARWLVPSNHAQFD